jgi:cytochrome P450 family 6
MGNFSGVGSEIHFFDRIQEIYEKCKGKDSIFGFYSSISPVYVVADEELVKLVMIKDFNNFVNRGMYVNEEDEPLTGEVDFLKGFLVS